MSPGERATIIILLAIGCGGSEAPPSPRPSIAASPATPGVEPAIPTRVPGTFELARGAGAPAELGRTFLIVEQDGSYRAGAWPASAAELRAAPKVERALLRDTLRAAGHPGVAFRPARKLPPCPPRKPGTHLADGLDDLPPCGDLTALHGGHLVVVATRVPQMGAERGRRGENVLLLVDAEAPALAVVDAITELPSSDESPGATPAAHLAVDRGTDGVLSAFRLETILGETDETPQVIEVTADSVWLGIREVPVPLTSTGGIEPRAFAALYASHVTSAVPRQPTVWLRADAPMSLVIALLDALAAADIDRVALVRAP